MPERNQSTLDVLREELSYQRRLIPKLEWWVRVCQAKLAKAEAEVKLLQEFHHHG